MNASNHEHVNASEHDDIELLLPWYVNATLDNEERRRVSQHLDECSACRESVRELEQIGAAVSRPSVTPIIPEPDAEALLQRLDDDSPPAAWRFPAVAALAAAVALTAAAVFIGMSEETSSPVYDLVTDKSPASLPMRHVLDVTFDPTTDANARTGLLTRLGATLQETAADGSVYRIVVEQPAMTFPELEAFRQEIEASVGVESASIVHVQPVQSTKP